MASKNIIVTGATGYIGGTFSYEALKKGFKVIGIDNFCNSSPDNEKKLSEFSNFTFFNCDISKCKETIKEIIGSHNIDAIIHFAGLKAVGDSEKEQALYWENNLLSTLNLLEAIKHGDIKFIFSSSATVYGDSKIQPITEETQTKTFSAYGSTKLAQELLISDYARAYKKHCISLRYFNPVGAHSDGVIFDDFRDSPNNLMPRILRVAKGLDSHIKIFGDDYNTADGTGERDYIHISDLIEGHFAALEKIKSLPGHSFFNLGTGKKTSVKELIDAFTSTTGIAIDVEVSARREGDVEICYASPKKANETLEWEAQKNLKDMCRDAWDAIKNEPESFK